MTQHVICDYAVMPAYFRLTFYPVTQLRVLHISAYFTKKNSKWQKRKVEVR